MRTLFVAYLAFLAWAILWKFGTPQVGGTDRIINLTPFAANTTAEMGFNLLVFVPFGIYLSLVAPRWAPTGKLMLLGGSSALLETAQYALAIGRTDITDLILNAAGGAAGIAAHAAFSRILGRASHRAWPAIAVLMTVGQVAVAILVSHPFLIAGQPPIGPAPGG